jgi:hypothetical protein
MDMEYRVTIMLLAVWKYCRSFGLVSSKGRPLAGNVNSFTVLQPEVRIKKKTEVVFVELVLMLDEPFSICCPPLQLFKFVACSEDKFRFLFQHMAVIIDPSKVN